MSSGDDKVRLFLRSGGEWVEGNGGWDYVCTEQTVQQGVKMKLNTTFKHLVGFCERKCGIDRSFGVTKLVYKNDGQMFQLTNDENVSWFLEFAVGLRKPPRIYVYVDMSVPDGGDGSGTSNTQVETESPRYNQQSYDDSFVPETQQHQQHEEEEEEEEEEDHRNFVGFDEDESHVLTLGLSDIDLSDSDNDDNEQHEEANILREGVNDYFDMPHPPPTPELTMTTNENVPYNRSSRVTCGQVFDTKDQMIIEVDQKFLQEGFEHRTKRSSRSRYEIVCARDDCDWRMAAMSVGSLGMFHVRKLHDVHTCSRTQLNPNHRQANKKVLGHMMKDKFLNARRALRPKDIIDDINQQYGITIGYNTGWRARWSALTLIRGGPAKSFTRLPTYLYNLERLNPGTRTAIKRDSTGRFVECFVALGVAVR